jgi:peptide/nickel transport system substrate-binding protein
MLAALVVVAVAAARPLAAGNAAAPLAPTASAAHTCLVMAGSGDPAFTKNFNPFTGNGLPSGQFVRGAIYEGLTVSPEGGKPTLPWLAKSWKWSDGNKTLTLQLQKGVKWSDGKPMTSTDVVYSLTAGKQNKVMDLVGFTRPDSNIASVKPQGSYAVVINLKTADSQFIAATLNAQYIIPRHIWSKVAHPDTFTNPNPVGTGPFTKITRFTTQDYVFSKNPNYWQAGKPLIPCLEYVQAASNDASIALTQSGQVDWTHNFVPNVDKAYTSKDPAHFHAFYATTAYPVSLVFDNTQYPYSLVAFRHALSMAIDRNTVSKLGEYGYAPPTDAIGLNGLFPSWVSDPTVKAHLQPDGGEDAAHGQRVHVQGLEPHRPEGQPRLARHPRDLRMVGLGRLEPDHHEEPPGHRHRLEREARAGLELLVPERVRHEEPDSALAERVAGLALRLLQREPLAELGRPVWDGRLRDG